MELMLKTEDLKEVIDRELLAWKVAEIIVEKYGKDSWQDWRNDFVREFEKKAKEVTKEFLEELELKRDIGQVIRDAIRNIGKEEILKLLSKG